MSTSRPDAGPGSAAAPPPGSLAAGGLRFTVDPRRVLRVGLPSVVLIAVVSTSGRLLAGDDQQLSGWLVYYVPLTNVDAEGGIPARYSSILMGCAAALWTVAQEARAAGERRHRYWRLLAPGFVVLSLDAVAEHRLRYVLPGLRQA